jgi:hypothetical protein
MNLASSQVARSYNYISLFQKGQRTSSIFTKLRNNEIIHVRIIFIRLMLQRKHFDKYTLLGHNKVPLPKSSISLSGVRKT